MKQDRILSILYDLALVIGGADQVQPLLVKTLQRLIFHTGFPCGLVLFRESDDAGSALRLRAAIGDHRLTPLIGQTIQLPAELVDGEADLLPWTEEDGAPSLPVRSGHFRQVLRLPIPDFGLILLFSPAKDAPTPFVEALKPILGNLSKAIRLCRNNEIYTDGLIADRDAARADNERFRRALDSSGDSIFLIDPASMRFIDCNRRALDELGYHRSELMGMGPADIKPDMDEPALRGVFERVLREEQGVELKSAHRRKDGATFPVALRINALHQPGHPPIIITVARDDTERRHHEDELFAAKERAQVTLESIGDGVITTDPDGLVDYMNPIACRLTGHPLAEALGQPLERIFRIFDEQTREPSPNPVDLCLSQGEEIGLSGVHLLSDRFERELTIEDTATPIRDRLGRVIGAVLVFRDLSASRAMARTLSWQALHDAMTGLPNRSAFEQALQAHLGSAAAEGRTHALLYLDLDQFKLVNDTCGHLAGDELLKQLALYLKNQMRESDMLARLGGDEFGVLLGDCPLEQASQIAEKLRRTVNEFRFVWEERSFEVGVSIGLVRIDSDTRDTSQAFSQADIACYAAKDQGRNHIHVYHSDDDDLRKRHSEMLWVGRINEALAQDRLRLHCQPIRPARHESDPEKQGLAHYELLVRMLDRDGSLIPPGAFIPAAERYKIMPTVDRWVIDNAFSFYRRLRHRDGDKRYLFTINLSGSSINEEGTRAYIESRLQHHGLDPGDFCFEITETTAISNLVRAHRLMREMRRTGFRFALDDFGSGVSSFAYLKNLPVDYLKLDGSFVRDILVDPIDDVMVAAINQIGHVMGLKTIAEFVENDAIRERLAEIGVDFVQGYGVGMPTSLSDEFGLTLH